MKNICRNNEENELLSVFIIRLSFVVVNIISEIIGIHHGEFCCSICVYVRGKIFNSYQNFRTISGVYPASYSLGATGS